MSVAGWIKDRLGIISPSIVTRDAYREVALTAMDAYGEAGGDGCAELVRGIIDSLVRSGWVKASDEWDVYENYVDPLFAGIQVDFRSFARTSTRHIYIHEPDDGREYL